MKTLTIVAESSTLPERNELRKMEESDRHPRATLFGDTLNTDLLDRRFMDAVPGLRRTIYRRLPGRISQLAEAYIVRNKYDAIISWVENIGFPFALMCKLTGTHPAHIAISSWLSKRKTSTVLRLAQTHVDRLILMSSIQHRFATETLGLPSSKVTLLKWPIDQKFWRPMNVPTDMISTAGREMRDFGTLIEALRDLPIRCHIAAVAVPGKKDAWIKDLSTFDPSNSTITVGRKPLHELRDIYARSRFVVVPLYPTDTDNGTTTILEAMAMGKAVICSRVAGQADVIQEGTTGIFVPPRDPRALRETIEHFWNHPEEAERMGREGRRRIEQYHALDRWVENVRKIVEEVVMAHHRRLRPADRRNIPLNARATDA